MARPRSLNPRTVRLSMVIRKSVADAVTAACADLDQSKVAFVERALMSALERHQAAIARGMRYTPTHAERVTVD